MFSQMSAKQGIKQFGKRLIAGIFNEYNQFHDKTVVGKIDPDTLSPEEKKKSPDHYTHQGNKLWKNQRTSMRRWKATAQIHPQGRGCIFNCINGNFTSVPNDRRRQKTLISLLYLGHISMQTCRRRNSTLLKWRTRKWRTRK